MTTNLRSATPTTCFVLVCFASLGSFASEDNIQTDQYGGLLAVRGTPAEMFHLERIGKRWWLVTPDGHGMFIRAVAKVNSHSNMDWGGSGGFQSYDAVYLQNAEGQFSANLKSEAESTLVDDVKLAGSDYTLKKVGDAIYIGTDRFKPNFTYFWLSRLGAGGRIEWYYSTADGWQKINKIGQPYKGVVLDDAKSFNFDIGNYIAPGKNGEGVSNDKNANKITWWNLKDGFPADFAKSRLDSDATARYWIKGVVVNEFVTAPLLNQTFERAEFEETVMRKYGPGDAHLKWAQAISERFKSWGLNAAGLYSYRYKEKAPQLKPRMPVEETWQLSGDSMKAPYFVKNMYLDAVFPPKGKKLWAAIHADPFDANYKAALMETALKEFKNVDKWTWALNPEEADWLFGFNYYEHAHLGYVVLAQNPIRLENTVAKTKYSDPKFYAKFALRDFLRQRYKDEKETLAPLLPESAVPLYSYADKPQNEELAALTHLNKAWGTAYTTWETSAGNLSDGTNAYGKGSGFLDEDGSNVVDPNAKRNWYIDSFTRAEFPAIRKDLDEFVTFAASRYGSIVQAACNQKPHPPVLMPIYRGVEFAYRGLGPYVDGFWAKPRNGEEAAAMYNWGRKPLLISDYINARADGQAYFKTSIKDVVFNKSSGNTVIHCPDLRYYFRSLLFIHFPEAEELNKNVNEGKGILERRPKIMAANWNTLEVRGDYTAHVRPGMNVELIGNYMAPHKTFPPETQVERAGKMIAALDSNLMATGDDGMQFAIGWEHWCLYDAGVNNTFEVGNFGFATLHDNAYDGVEAARSGGTDQRGYPIGGEEGDYGNLIGPLSEYLRNIDKKLISK